MAAVMIAGWGRRLVQRRWLGLAIGILLHLVLAATWARRDVFWWPFLGDASDGPTPIGTSGRIVCELIGAVVAVWLWRRLGFGDATRLRTFIRTGRVDRSATAH